MLFSQGSDLVRIQCAFVDTPEVEGIAQYIGNQQGYSSAFELPEYIGEMGEDKVGNIDLNDRDPLFEEAARLLVVHQQGSTSLIQRKFYRIQPCWSPDGSTGSSRDSRTNTR